MSGSPWFKDAHRMPSHRANPMAHNNSSKKLVLHTSEGDAHQSAQSLAQYVINEAKEYSAVINAYSGDVVQIYPINTGARSLLNGGLHGGIGCNRSGQICFQVVIVGKTADGHHLIQEALRHEKVRDFFKWMHEDWGIPAVDLTKHGRSIEQWDKSGVTCHANAPGNDHTDHVPVEPIIAAMKSGSSGHQQQDQGDHRQHHGQDHPAAGKSEQHADHHHGQGHGDKQHEHGHGGDGHHAHKSPHSPPTNPGEPHYLVLIAHGDKAIPLLNKDGAESGWTIDPAEAKGFPHGHVRYEHVDEAIAWAKANGLTVAKVLRAKPADHHPDHEHKRHHKPDGKKGSGKLTKNSSTHWPTDKRTVERLKKVAEDLGVELRVVSGYRSYSEQAKLYYGWTHHLPGYNLAAPPGKSNHNFGHAADTDVVDPKSGKLISIGNWPGARAALKKHGLVLSVASEAWHVDPKEIAHWANPPIP